MVIPAMAGAATKAMLNYPSGAAVDAAGNLFIVDANNARIRKVDGNGINTTVAGSGNSGYNGNGLTATNSNFNFTAGNGSSEYYYSGIVVDSDDDLLLADSYNQRLRLETYGIVITLAGTGSAGYSGDGGPADSAEVNYPAGLAVDASGNLYFADARNFRIRKVDENGIITTVAGNGRESYSGDGGTATNASFENPTSLAMDASGNLFIGDEYTGRIRQVTPAGIIMTVAGGGNASLGDGGMATNASLVPSGVCVDGYDNLFVSDPNNRRVREINSAGIITTVAGNGANGYSGDGGAATNASLGRPDGVAVDAQRDLFIADTYNNRIRKVTPAGPALTLATVNATNAGSYQVIVSSADGSVTSVVATLTADLAPMVTQQPTNQSVLYEGTANFAAGATGTAPLAYQWLFNGTNLPANANITGPTNASLNLGQVTAANAGSYTVVITNARGSVTSSVATLTVKLSPVIVQAPTNQSVLSGNGVTFGVVATGAPPLVYQWLFNGAKLTDGGGLSGSASPNLVLSQVTSNYAGYYVVAITNAWGSVVTTGAWLTVLQPPGIAIQPVSQSAILGQSVTFHISATGTGPLTYQWLLNGTNLPNGIISTVAGCGTNGFAGDGGAATNASLNNPAGVAVDDVGNVYIADTFNSRIRKVDLQGIITTVAGAGTNGTLNYPYGVAVDAAGYLFIADSGDYEVIELGTNGTSTVVDSIFGYEIIGVALTAGGNVLFTSTTERVLDVSASGFTSTLAGNDLATGFTGDGGPATSATLNDPYGVAADAAGNVFFADELNQRVRKVNSAGIISTVAGNGGAGFAGDGGVATNASLNQPMGVAVDTFGNLFIGDNANDRIRKVDASGVIITVAGNGNYAYSGDGGAATNACLNQPNGVAVDSLGNLYIADLGNACIRKVLLEGPTLTLPGVEATNAGNYQVVVSSPYGSVTSSIVNLSVVLPQISATANRNGSVTLNLLTTPNASSEVLAATNLTPPVVWQSLGTNVPGSSGIWQFTDTNASQYPVRFYRSSTP